MYIILLLIFLIIIYLYIIYFKNLRYFPGPIPLPLIGSIHYLIGLKSRGEFVLFHIALKSL